MSAHVPPSKRQVINRRAFLRAAGGVAAVGLPFLEGMPERSAWAQNATPHFAFFMVGACGVVQGRFWPGATGALSAGSLGADKAVGALADHAANLLIVRNVNFPMGGPTNCGHAQGLCQALTGRAAGGGGQSATSTGVSADVFLAKAINAGGAESMNLYAGNKRNGYIAERISFNGSGAGQVRSAADNPYELYAKVVGLTTSGGGGTTNPNPTTPTMPTTPTAPGMADELVLKRKSVNDLVREELNALRNRSALSAADKMRLDQHFQAIRDIENTMMGMAGASGMAGSSGMMPPSMVNGCTKDGIDDARLQALKSGFAFTTNGMIEEVAKLHMQVVALAFACNYNRVAAMQWGDGTDQTRYDVPSNASLRWPFHHLSHRVQSDASSGSNSTAEAAHAEVDKLRMQTLAAGLEAFKARGLQDKCVVLWTNHVADGPSHSFRNVPHIIWGSPGGYLKQGQYVDAGGVTNDKVLNTLLTAAGVPTDNFGGSAGGTVAAMKA